MDRIEGTRWNEDKVCEYKTEKDFVNAWLNDAGTYAGVDPAKKAATLRLVYSLATGHESIAEVQEDISAPKLEEMNLNPEDEVIKKK